MTIPATADAEALQLAKAADLVYVSDDTPGISRRRFGRGFAYYAPTGRKLTSTTEIERIKALVIPPAYENVWICPLANGHLQVTGEDQRGRKQYRYHERWREVRDRAKFDALLDFAAALPRIRRTTGRHLRLSGLPREKVLAAVVRVLDATLMRIGNEEYTRTNGSFGLTTLRARHADVAGREITFRYTAKGGKPRELTMTHKRLAGLVRKCQDLPGQQLFAYRNDRGDVIDVTSQSVNDYLRAVADGPFTAKDFRTWAGTVETATTLRDLGPAETKTALKKNTITAIDATAKLLGNTRAVSRKSYIHPTVLEAYENGEVLGEPRKRTRLRQDESAVVRLLEANR
ncbi:MAG: DNA topoisomerase IB [Planctomycetota bacterium]